MEHSEKRDEGSENYSFNDYKSLLYCGVLFSQRPMINQICLLRISLFLVFQHLLFSILITRSATAQAYCIPKHCNFYQSNQIDKRSINADQLKVYFSSSIASSIVAGRGTPRVSGSNIVSKPIITLTPAKTTNGTAGSVLP